MSTPSAVAVVGAGVAAVWPEDIEALGGTPVEAPGEPAGAVVAGRVASEVFPGPSGVVENCELADAAPADADPADAAPADVPAEPLADPEPAATSPFVPEPPATTPEPVLPELAARAPTAMITKMNTAPSAAIAECEIPRERDVCPDCRAATIGVAAAASRGMRDCPHSLHQSALSGRLAPQASQNWPRARWGRPPATEGRVCPRVSETSPGTPRWSPQRSHDPLSAGTTAPHRTQTRELCISPSFWAANSQFTQEVCASVASAQK
jgi:hypothetical protein